MARAGRRARTAWWGALLLLLAAGVWTFRAYLFSANLHEVIPERVYRSAQPDGARLEAWIAELGLRSVVNLRGDTPGDPAYHEVLSVAREHGVALHELRLSADRMPSREEVQRLVGILDAAERPMLVHCQSGVDRSGLAALLVRLLEGQDLERARAELSPSRAFFAPLSPMDEWLERYEGWLRDEGLDHAPRHLRRFVADDYVPHFYAARIEPLDVPRRLPAGVAHTVRFRVTNTSPEPWRFTPGNRDATGVHLALNLKRQRRDGTWPDGRHLRGETPDRVFAPGESIELEAELPALEPGRYRLVVDLVDEWVKFFADMGYPALDLELRVEDEEGPGATASSS